MPSNFMGFGVHALRNRVSGQVEQTFLGNPGFSRKTDRSRSVSSKEKVSSSTHKNSDFYFSLFSSFLEIVKSWTRYWMVFRDLIEKKFSGRVKKNR